METITFNNGVDMPALGLGVFQHHRTRPAPPSKRHSAPQPRTATSARSARPCTTRTWTRSEIWNSDYGYDETLHGFEKSAGKLGVDQVDLLILHQALTVSPPEAVRPFLKSAQSRFEPDSGQPRWLVFFAWR